MGVGALTPLFEQAGKPLPINTPQDIALKQAQIQNLQSQGAAQQQQTQEQALKNQQLQQQMGEYNTIRNYVAQNGGDYSKALAPDSPLASQISPQTWLGLQKTLQDTQGTAATAAKSHADAELAEQQAQAAINKGTQDYQDHLATLAHSLLSTGAQPAAVLAALDTEKGLNPQHADSITKLQQSFMQNPQMIQQQLGQLFLQGSPTVQANLQEQDNKNAAAPGTVAETAARTNLTNAQTETANLNNQQKQKLSALPDSAWNSAVDAVAGGDNAAAMATKAQVQFYRAQGNFEKANEAIDNLAKLKGATREDIGKAVAVENATAPIKISTEAAAANARENATGANLDREAKQYGSQYQKALSDADTQLDKIADARAMINGNAEAQALGVPKTLTSLVGGAGSGVRITQPELNAILKARGIQGDFQGFINSISGQGKLTPTQQQQLTGILDDVKTRISQKRQIASDALDSINGAKDRNTILGADKAARDRISAMETAPASSGGKYKAGDTRTINGKIYTRDDKGNWSTP